MNNDEKKRLSTKLFVGCLITSEVKMHLNQSVSWKNAKIYSQIHLESLVEIRFKKKNYLGCYLKNNKVTPQELKEIQTKLQSSIKSHCPNLESGHLTFYILSQFFVA